MTERGLCSRTVVQPNSRPAAAPEMERNYTPREHPIAAKDYILPTDEMYALHEFMLDAIDLGYDGSIIYGSAYAGKSSAVMEVCKWLEKDHSADFLPYRVTMSEKNYKYKEFFQYLSEQIGCSLPVKTTDANRVVENFLSSLAIRAHKHNNKVVLVLDEVENLQIEHYKNLKFVFNRLRDEGITLITFLVGTDALLTTKEIFESSGSIGEQITRRFMQGMHHFHGITDEEQLKYVLEGYDSMMFAGQTYTQHYFPEAWKKGMRLADLTEDMLKEMLSISGLPSLPEVPMGYITKIINALFLTYGFDSVKTDGEGNPLKKNWITKDDIRNIMYKQNIEVKLIELSAKKHSRTRKGGLA